MTKRISKVLFSAAGLNKGDKVYYIPDSKSYKDAKYNPILFTVVNPVKNSVLINGKKYDSINAYVDEFFGISKPEQVMYYTYKLSTIVNACAALHKDVSELTREDLRKTACIYHIVNDNQCPDTVIYF